MSAADKDPVVKEIKRSSVLTGVSFGDVNTGQRFGGYLSELDTGMEIIDCYFFEPLEMQFAKAECERSGLQFKRIGVIVCIHGEVPSEEVLDEWGSVAQHTGILGLGITVAVPNVQMSSLVKVEEILRIIDAILKKQETTQCLLIGKGWGGPLVTSVAVEHPDKVVGLILTSPSAPAPEEATELFVPVLMMWSEDDDTVPFEDSESYLETIEESVAPLTLHFTSKGGHNFDRVLTDRAGKEKLKDFISFIFSVGDYAEELTRGRPGGQSSDSDSSSESDGVPDAAELDLQATRLRWSLNRLSVKR